MLPRATNLQIYETCWNLVEYSVIHTYIYIHYIHIQSRGFSATEGILLDKYVVAGRCSPKFVRVYVLFGSFSASEVVYPAALMHFKDDTYLSRGDVVSRNT